MSKSIERILVCGRTVHISDEFTEAERALMESLVAERHSELCDDVVITTARGRVLPDPNSQAAIEGTVWGLQNKYDLRGFAFQTEFREQGGYSFLVVYFGEHLDIAEVASAGDPDRAHEAETGGWDATDDGIESVRVEGVIATEIDGSEISSEGIDAIDGEVVYCPSCGVTIQPFGENCRFCGEWLAGSPTGAAAIGREEPVRVSCRSCNASIAPGLRWCPLCRSHTNNPELGGLASPGVRVGATLIDIGIPWGGFFLAEVFFGGSDQLLGPTLLLGMIGYLLLSLTLFPKGKTPGKKLMGLTVITKRGTVAGLGIMILREIIGKTFSCCVLGLGFLWILFDSERQGWHDKLAGTYVVTNKA